MACDTIKIETLDADEVVSIVTQGPQGPSGSEAATLTTTGDMLYRAALANDRLPIGSEGQVLKVSSGIPAWGNESGAVTSVNGETGAVVLDAADVGAQSVFVEATLSITSTPHTLQGGRAQRVKVSTALNQTTELILPTANNQNQDIIQTIRHESVGENQPILIKNTFGGTTLATLNYNTSDSFTFRYQVGPNAWSIIPVDTHTHPAADISDSTTAGRALLTDADAAAQRTTLGLGTAATSASTDFAAASHTHGNITNGGLVGTTANLPLKTGTGGIVEAGVFGTGAGEFAEGNHTHTQLHDRSHAITSTSDHTAGNHKVFYSNGSGEIVELALGNSGKVLQSNGATSAPTWETPSGGSSIMQSIAVGFVLN